MEPAMEHQQRVFVRMEQDELVKSVLQRFSLNQGAKPLIGAVVITGITVVVASEIGVAELAVAVAAGYISYRMLKYGMSLPEALVEGFRMRRGEIPI